MLTLDQARSLADSYAAKAGARWFPDVAPIERPEYWFLPVGYIGSSGVIVCKSSGRLTPLGSAFTVDDWLWGYERGLVADGVTLRILSVTDAEATLAVLQGVISGTFRWRYELRNWLKHSLAVVPIEFRDQHLALAIPQLREAELKNWFSFEIKDGCASTQDANAAKCESPRKS